MPEDKHAEFVALNLMCGPNGELSGVIKAAIICLVSSHTILACWSSYVGQKFSYPCSGSSDQCHASFRHSWGSRGSALLPFTTVCLLFIVSGSCWGNLDMFWKKMSQNRQFVSPKYLHLRQMSACHQKLMPNLCNQICGFADYPSWWPVFESCCWHLFLFSVSVSFFFPPRLHSKDGHARGVNFLRLLSALAAPSTLLPCIFASSYQPLKHSACAH